MATHLDTGLQQSASLSLAFPSERKRCLVKYEPILELGAGAFGVVYKCLRQIPGDKNGDVVAVKRIHIKEASDGIPQWALREIALLNRCSARHPNIISLLDMHYMCTGKRCDIYLVLDYCDMDLKEFIRLHSENNRSPDSKTPSGIPPGLLKDVLYQMLKGLDFLHVMAVAHRDIKPQNVLVKNSVVKIADFGLGKVMFDRSPLSLEVITLHYRPPEVLLSLSYSLAVDIWSIGCIFAEMCNNQVLLEGRSEIDQLKQVFKILGVPDRSDWPVGCSVGLDLFMEARRGNNLTHLDQFAEYVGPRGVHLMKSMLAFNPLKRCSTKSALQHDYFDKHECSVAYQDYPDGTSIPA